MTTTMKLTIRHVFYNVFAYEISMSSSSKKFRRINVHFRHKVIGFQMKRSLNKWEGNTKMFSKLLKSIQTKFKLQTSFEIYDPNDDMFVDDINDLCGCYIGHENDLKFVLTLHVKVKPIISQSPKKPKQNLKSHNECVSSVTSVRLNAALNAYYKHMGVHTYQDDGVGKFLTYVIEQDFDEDALEDELGDGADFEDCELVQFDPDIPLKKDNLTEQEKSKRIFLILQNCYKHGTWYNPVDDSKLAAPLAHPKYTQSTAEVSPKGPVHCSGDDIQKCRHMKRLISLFAKYEIWNQNYQMQETIQDKWDVLFILLDTECDLTDLMDDTNHYRDRHAFGNQIPYLKTHIMKGHQCKRSHHFENHQIAKKDGIDISLEQHMKLQILDNIHLEWIHDPITILKSNKIWAKHHKECCKFVHKTRLTPIRNI
eukprot:340549_1